MPSSGARSGTAPSRSERGAGTGRLGPRILKCGHTTHRQPDLGNPPRWWCDECSRFVASHRVSS